MRDTGVSDELEAAILAVMRRERQARREALRQCLCHVGSKLAHSLFFFLSMVIALALAYHCTGTRRDHCLVCLLAGSIMFVVSASDIIDEGKKLWQYM